MAAVDWIGRRAELVALIERGCGRAEIAAHFRAKPCSVASALRRAGLSIDAGAARARRVAHLQSAGARAAARQRMAARMACPAYVARLKACQREAFRVGRHKRVRWCPTYLRAEYRALCGKLCGQGVAAYARSVIEAQWHRDLRRALASIAEVAAGLHAEQSRAYRSFDAELARARVNGIRELVPMRQAVSHPFSLVGGSLA